MEIGMQDMGHYFSKEQMPTMGFTPDACYGVCHCEKGLFRFAVTGKVGKKIVSFKAGTVVNAVPYKAEAEQRIRDMAQQQHAQAIQQLKSPEERDKEMLDAAPKAFNNALSIIDREIDKQQEKNDSLKKQINQDIESQAVKLAHERGYTIVFNKFRVNMKAEDITAAIIKALKKA